MQHPRPRSSVWGITKLDRLVICRMFECLVASGTNSDSRYQLDLMTKRGGPLDDPATTLLYLNKRKCISIARENHRFVFLHRHCATICLCSSALRIFCFKLILRAPASSHQQPFAMSTVQHGDSTVQEVESTIGNARFSKGKWFCECHVAARCLTATKNSSHQGKKCMFT